MLESQSYDGAVWALKNVIRKLDSYKRAQQYLQGYESAPMGIDFQAPGATLAFRTAVENAVKQWQSNNPGIPVEVKWAE